RYVGIEVDDALAIAEQVDVLTAWAEQKMLCLQILLLAGNVRCSCRFLGNTRHHNEDPDRSILTRSRPMQRFLGRCPVGLGLDKLQDIRELTTISPGHHSAGHWGALAAPARE